VQSLTGVFMSTIEFAAGGRIRIEGLKSRNVFLYVVRGVIEVEADKAGACHLVELNGEGDAVEMAAETDALVLFGHAEPTDEPMVAHGPFVMNTREEISQAIADYQAGRFGAPPRGFT
jgi:redox-sensitive bicupin YhaK (pirin superfamily)